MARATSSKKADKPESSTATHSAARTSETVGKHVEEASAQAETTARQAQETMVESTEALREQVAEMVRAPFDYTQVFAVATANMDACVKANEAWLRGMTAINQELASFAQARMTAAGEAARSLATTNGTGNWAEASLDYAREVTEQYAAEASKLAQLSSETAQAGLTPLQECWRNTAQKAA